MNSSAHYTTPIDGQNLLFVDLMPRQCVERVGILLEYLLTFKTETKFLCVDVNNSVAHQANGVSCFPVQNLTKHTSILLSILSILVGLNTLVQSEITQCITHKFTHRFHANMPTRFKCMKKCLIWL